MIETSFITWPCGECNALNDLPLDYFIHPDYELGKIVLASCESCNRESIVNLKEVLTQ